MAYDYLELVNELCRRVNETELTSVNFSTAVGFYSTAKSAVNEAILDINRQDYEWPFNHVSYTQTLTAGTNRYSFPAGFKTADMDSFRIARNNSLNVVTTKLSIISYEDYLDRVLDDEYNSDTSIRRVPKYVFRTPNGGYGVWPVPDQAYALVYEYYAIPSLLSAYSDVPTVPEVYKNVITEGGMIHVENFREEPEKAAQHQAKFNQMISQMRSLLTNRYDYMRTPYVDHLRYPFGNYWSGYN